MMNVDYGSHKYEMSCIFIQIELYTMLYAFAWIKDFVYGIFIFS